jgi:uncharacterized protein (TIGR03437 family)
LKTLVFAGLIVALSGIPPAPAQTSAVAHLAVQSGNGQVLCPLPTCTLQVWQPISVKATDVNGSPVTGATVSWTVTSGQIVLGSSTSVTGTNGIATENLSQTIIDDFAGPGMSYSVNTIQAASNNNSVIFTETQSLINDTTPASEIEADPPTYGGTNLSQATLSAKVGTTLSTPIQVLVAGLDIASNGVANISVRIVNEQTSPTLTCANQGGYADPGSVLTNAQGIANCYPVFSGSGTGTFYILIGGVPATDISTALYLQEYPAYTSTSSGYSFTSIPGAPAAVQIVSGNYQVGNIGQALSPLVAKLVDANGNPVQGATMVWSVVPAGAVALANGNAVTDNNGEVTTTVALDELAAPAGAAITVALQGTPGISATFQETVQGSVSTMTVISGNNQTAQIGTPFASPLVVQLLGANGPVANYPVQYVVSGPVSLPGGTGTTVSTNASGEASVTVTAGNLSGTASVTAVAGSLQQVFNLNITTAPLSPPPSSISIVSGNSQSAIVNASFPQPLVVQVNNSAGPVSGYTVIYSTTGPVSLSGPSAVTNSSGQASINVTAGATAGAATVTATANEIPVTFNLTVTPPGPAINTSSFLNAASRQVGALSPCSLAIIAAAGLTPEAGIADLTGGPIFGRIPKSYNNLTVSFGGFPAPIMRVAMGTTYPEVTVQVPCEVTPAASVPVVVNVNGGGTATVNIPIAAVSPGIFQQVMSDGVSRAVAVRSDGTFADIGGTDISDPNNPIRLNEVVRFYLTGLGATLPASVTDTIEDPDSYISNVENLVTGTIQVGFPGSPSVSVQVLKAHQAPGLIGVYEVDVEIPGNAPTGNNVPLSIGIVPAGSSSSTPGTFGPQSTVPIGQ